MKVTKKQFNKIDKRIDRAIDAMIDIQDKGVGNETVQRILDLLELMRSEYESK